MHQFLATLLSLLLSFGHHTAPTHAGATFWAAREFSPSALSFPDRRALARGTEAEASYATSACVSCSTMTATFTVR